MPQSPPQLYRASDLFISGWTMSQTPEVLSTVSITKPPVCTCLPPGFCLLLTSVIPADPLSLIHTIHQRGMRAGIAISPDTPSTVITDEIGAAADLLLVMTVYPGAAHPQFPFPGDLLTSIFRSRRAEIHGSVCAQSGSAPSSISR